MRKTMKLLQRISGLLKSDTPNKMLKFIIGWIIAFDTIGGTFIPIAYGKGCGWFAIPNLIIDICVIINFVRRLKNVNSH